MIYFIDTNCFLSYFLNRDLSQQLIVTKLFQKALQNKIRLTTSTLVFFEVYWTLKSFYNLPFPIVKKTMTQLANLSFIDIDNRDLLIQSLSLFTSYSMGLDDCCHLAFAKSNQANSVATFDQRLKSSFSKLRKISEK